MPATVRVSEDTHQTLSALARETHKAMGDVLEIAVERYRRDVLLDAADRAYAEWRSRGEPDDEAAAWEGTLADGLPDER